MPTSIYDSDLSPFLVHLTRSRSDGTTAKNNLLSIIQYKTLFAGPFLVDDYSQSDARFAVPSGKKLTPDGMRKLFAFISFTETPLKYIRRLFDVKGRNKDLTHYGLVFFKDRLIKQGVSPVLYINNARGDRNELVGVLASLIETHPKEAHQILPLISIFGKKLNPGGGKAQTEYYPGFAWEREWRFPVAESPLLEFNEDDVLVGLCPESEIQEFEKAFPPVPFIDARKFGAYSRKLHMRRSELK